MSQKVITICSSANFYKHVDELAHDLEKRGYKVLLPETVYQMRASGDFEVSHYKTWYDNPDDFAIKKHKMDEHFKEVEKADAILIVNDEKHGQPSYIGANVLMEMALAYYLKKPIYILNDVPKDLNVYEEVVGMAAVRLGGDLQKISL